VETTLIKSYKRILYTAETEFTEKKSRFISNITPVSSEEEALFFLRGIREKHREANHNVYAYRINNGNICRHSDDGEPSGTAGMPLLNVFLRQDVYDFCCVATRYFGGVLLGAGGLVRAYARCGADALEMAGIGLMCEIALCTVTMPYTLYETVKRFLTGSGTNITAEEFGAEVLLGFTIQIEEVPGLQNALTQLTAGTVKAEVTGTRMEAVKTGNSMPK